MGEEVGQYAEVLLGGAFPGPREGWGSALTELSFWVFIASDPVMTVCVVMMLWLAWQQGLENMYANMGDETFKTMRRKLTISKTRMEWNVSAHRLAKTLGK